MIDGLKALSILKEMSEDFERRCNEYREGKIKKEALELSYDMHCGEIRVFLRLEIVKIDLYDEYYKLARKRYYTAIDMEEFIL